MSDKVTVKKTKNGVDTVIEYKGNTYQLVHKNQMTRGQKR